MQYALVRPEFESGAEAKSLSETTGARSICSPSRSLNAHEWSELDIMPLQHPQVLGCLEPEPELDLRLQVKINLR